MNNFGELLSECWDSKSEEKVFEIKRTADPGNLLERCRALEGKVPDDKDSEEKKISKLNEITTWTDLGWQDLMNGRLAPDLTGYKVLHIDSGVEYSVIGTDEKYIQLKGHKEIPIGDAFIYDKEWELLDPEGITIPVDRGADEGKVNEQDEPEDIEPSMSPEEPKEAPEDKEMPEPEPSAEEEAPEITKEYIGRSEDTHFYMVSTETDEGLVEDLELVDQEGVKKYSAKDNNLDPAEVDNFIIQVIQDIEINEIERSVFMKYILPKILEEEEPEPEEEELEDEEKPEKEEAPEEEEPVESKKTLSEMKVIDGENNEFDVLLVDDGTLDTVIDINGREFRFDAEFASLFRDEEGTLSEEGLEELALDALANLEEDEYNELIGAAKEDAAEEYDVSRDDEGKFHVTRGGKTVNGPFDTEQEARDAIKELEGAKEDVGEVEEVKEQKEIPTGWDVNRNAITKGDKVFADDGRVQGKVEAIWDDGSVDIVYASGPGGPLADTFDIKGHSVTKFSEDVEEKKKPPVCKKCGKKHWPFEKCSVKKSKEKPEKESVEVDEENKETSEAKMGVDYVKTLKKAVKDATTALKDKDYDAAAKALEDAADDASDGARAAKKMKREEDSKAKAEEEKEKAEESEKVEEAIRDPRRQKLAQALKNKGYEISASYKDPRAGGIYRHKIEIGPIEWLESSVLSEDQVKEIKQIVTSIIPEAKLWRGRSGDKRLSFEWTSSKEKAEEEAKKEKEEEKPKEESVEEEKVEETKLDEKSWWKRILDDLRADSKFASLVKEHGLDSDEVHKYVSQHYFAQAVSKMAIDDVIRSAATDLPGPEDVDEKKKPPVCKKCNTAHWPFQKCGVAKKSKEKSEEGKVPDDKDSEQKKIDKLTEKDGKKKEAIKVEQRKPSLDESKSISCLKNLLNL